MRTLGHRTYLEAKAEGESSMSGKAGCAETIEAYAGRGPDGMVKPKLVEPQCPSCKRLNTDTVGDIRDSSGDREPGLLDAPDVCHSGTVARLGSG